MNTPMHRYKYTKLTKGQILKKLTQAESGPNCISDFSGYLSGKSIKIINDNGPVLSYRFNNEKTLTFSEDGGKSINAAYGSLDLKHMIFFSHMVPDSLRGYNIVIDLDTNLVTVFEIWFCGGKDNQGQVLDNREVQRQIYFGYLEVPGESPPEKRHHSTNRIEGKGTYWKQDTGIETLEFYSSVSSSNFVELTRHCDNLGFCSPSDYILINDNIYIYDRTECEFSGIMTLYLAEQLTETQIGVRLGFNEKDKLEYYMFRGNGKLLGYLTRLEPFYEHGEDINPGMGPESQEKKKGERAVYRPVRSFVSMSEEEMHRAAEKRTVSFRWDPDMVNDKALETTSVNTPSGSMSANTPPLSSILAGKEFLLRYDNNGPVWEYKVADKRTLYFRKPGESQWRREPYRAFEIDEDLVFFCHMHSGSRPRKSVKIALDLTNGLTTCISSKMGNAYHANEIDYKVFFGTAEMEGVAAPKYIRHDFTDELVGKGFSRTWSDTMTSMHLYTTPYSASWTIYMEDQALGLQWSAPCVYIKLRKGIYIFNLHEEAGTANETCVAINERNMRIWGFGFYGSKDGVELDVIGAIARPIGGYDVKEYFGPKAKGV